MTGSHNPAPGSLETGSQQPTPRRCAAETLAPPNHRDLRGYRCRGEAGFQTRGHCQSCFSSCSKLTRGRRGLQGGASSRTRESVGVGVGGGEGGRCSSVDGAGGRRSWLRRQQAQPGRRVWCLEPPRARRCMAGKGEVARPLPAAPVAARAGETQRSAPCFLPLLCLLRERLVCGET